MKIINTTIVLLRNPTTLLGIAYAGICLALAAVGSTPYLLVSPLLGILFYSVLSTRGRVELCTTPFLLLYVLVLYFLFYKGVLGGSGFLPEKTDDYRLFYQLDFNRSQVERYKYFFALTDALNPAPYKQVYYNIVTPIYALMACIILVMNHRYRIISHALALTMVLSASPLFMFHLRDGFYALGLISVLLLYELILAKRFVLGVSIIGVFLLAANFLMRPISAVLLMLIFAILNFRGGGVKLAVVMLLMLGAVVVIWADAPLIYQYFSIFYAASPEELAEIFGDRVESRGGTAGFVSNAIMGVIRGFLLPLSSVDIFTFLASINNCIVMLSLTFFLATKRRVGSLKQRILNRDFGLLTVALALALILPSVTANLRHLLSIKPLVVYFLWMFVIGRKIESRNL